MVKENISEWTQDVIISELRRQLEERRPVTLYNTYRGVPITYEAEIAMVHPKYVGVVVHPYQTVCINNERRTYLQCKGIPELVRGHPVSIDYTSHVVLLDQLKIPHSISVDLDNSWIKPRRKVRVEIDSDLGERLNGELLSLAILSDNVVRVVVKVPEDCPYGRQDIIELTFKLPIGGELIQVGGLVHSLTRIRTKPERRLEVEGKAVMRDEIALLAYIANREDGVMRALDEEFRKLRNKNRGK